jgi:hypothetical protein
VNGTTGAAITAVTLQYPLQWGWEMWLQGHILAMPDAVSGALALLLFAFLGQFVRHA